MDTEAGPDSQPNDDEFAPRRPRSLAPHDRFFVDGEEPPERYDQEDEPGIVFHDDWKVTPRMWARISRIHYSRFLKGSLWLFLVYAPMLAIGWFPFFMLPYLLLEPLTFSVLTRRALQQLRGVSQSPQDLKTYGWLLLLRFVTLSWEYIIAYLGSTACDLLPRGQFHFPWRDVLACLVLAPIVLPAAAVKWRLTRFAAILIVDKRVNPAKALRLSWRIWKGRFWPLFGLELFIVALQAAGAYPFGIGLIFLTPFTMLFWTAAYLDIMDGPIVPLKRAILVEDSAIPSSPSASNGEMPTNPAQEKQ